MPSPVFGVFQESAAFARLAEVFPDPDSSRAFLLGLGLPIGKLPVPGSMAPATFWFHTCLLIDQGISRTVDLVVLARAAADAQPGSRGLADLLARALAVSGDPDGTAEDTGPGDEIHVLLLQAAPNDQARLRLDVEEREIVAISREHAPVTLRVSRTPATRATDIVPALLRARPTIVHFAGHGDQDGGVLFEDVDGYSQAVPADVLADVLAGLPGLRCVVLNACYLGGYGERLLGPASTVVGSTSAIGDRAALAFSRGFYRGLAYGEDEPKAYGWGLREMRLAGYPTDAMAISTS